jgi:hypothetical protein
MPKVAKKPSRLSSRHDCEVGEEAERGLGLAAEQQRHRKAAEERRERQSPRILQQCQRAAQRSEDDHQAKGG